MRGIDGRILGVALLIAGVMTVGQALAAVADEAPPVQVAVSQRHLRDGQIVGFEGSGGSLAWLGIPYAAPPVGELRWKAPRPPQPWQGLRPMLRKSEACRQVGFSGALGSEDCLYLNVWAPKPPAGTSKPPLPVMFWIHGGGNVMGEGASFDGGLLATSQNVVVVTINYRLGPFGWFSHPALRDGAESADDRSGNYALLDMLCALRWVRDNIAAFGGDPRNVTVFGESAGGADVLALLAAPPAKGLFQRAIAQSPYLDSMPQVRAEAAVEAGGTPRSTAELLLRMLVLDGRAADRGAALAVADRMSATETAAYLRGKPLESLLQAYVGLPDTDAAVLSPMGVPQMVEDGHVLPAGGVRQAFADGAINAVPLIIGSTRDEMRIMLGLFPVPPFSQAAAGGVDIPDPARFDAAAEYSTRLWKAAHVDSVADLLARRLPGKVFVYRFDWDQLAPSPKSGNISFGACHGLDVPFVFGHTRLGPEYVHGALIHGAAVDSFHQLSARLMSYWSRFAIAGAPGRGRSGRLPAWQAWKTGRETMLLDAPERGGIRQLSLREDRAPLLAAIAADRRFATPAARCAFIADLATLRIAGISPADQARFRRAACP